MDITALLAIQSLPNQFALNQTLFLHVKVLFICPLKVVNSVNITLLAQNYPDSVVLESSAKSRLGLTEDSKK